MRMGKFGDIELKGAKCSKGVRRSRVVPLNTLKVWLRGVKY
jgi:hypothetical protein